jgi:hypothetical protein
MIPCTSCAQCHIKFGSAESGLIKFSDGQVTHKGGCQRKYEQEYPAVKVLSIVRLYCGTPQVLQKLVVSTGRV